MAILDLVLYPDDPLTLRAKPIREVGPGIHLLYTDMVETMHAYEGVGLAGPQVGLSMRIFVLCEPGGDPMGFINPVLSEMEGNEVGEEGCLSLPRIYGMVPRATRLRVQAQNESGGQVDFVAEGFLARIIQHEYDHLEGILFPERLDILSREEKLREWTAVRRELNQAAQRSTVDT